MATGPTNPGELYFTNAGVTIQGVTFTNNVIVGTGTAPAGSQPVQNMPTSGWSNNVVTTGTPTFFTAPTGTNPSFVPASGDTMLTAKGATGNAVPSADIGLDPKCLVKRTPVMVGQVARVSTWQYDVDIDYIKSIGGVAKCFNPKARSGTPDIGAYRPGTVTAIAPGSCVAPPITGTGGSGGAGGNGGTAGSGGAGGRGGASATGGTTGSGGGGRGGTAGTGMAGATGAGTAGTGAGTGGSTGGGTAGTGPTGSGGIPAGTGGVPTAGSGGTRARAAARDRSAAAQRPAERRAAPELRPPEAAARRAGPRSDRARARREAAAARCLDRSTDREHSRLSGSWRSAREPSGVADARDLIVPALGAYRLPAASRPLVGRWTRPASNI